MALKGPIILKFSEVPGKYPSVVKGPTFVAENGITGDFGYPALFNELIANCNDGRVWLRKRLPNNDELVKNPLSYYNYNYEQIGGPYVIIEKTGGHTLSAEDTGRILEMNVSSSTTVTIPSYTGGEGVPFVSGTEVKVLLTNTGPVNITGASGVTLNSKSGFQLSSQWGMASLIKRGTNSWVITGDIT